MLFRYHLNEFDAEPNCPKCLNESCMNVRFCQGDSVTKQIESLIPPSLPSSSEKPYCSIFIVPHLDWECSRCGFMWYSACADTETGIVKRVNRYIASKRKKESEWPEVIKV